MAPECASAEKRHRPFLTGQQAEQLAAPGQRSAREGQCGPHPETDLAVREVQPVQVARVGRQQDPMTLQRQEALVGSRVGGSMRQTSRPVSSENATAPRWLEVAINRPSLPQQLRAQ